MTRPTWTGIWTGESFEALPLVQASLRLKPMKKQHAERLAEKFGPGSEAA